MLRLMPNWRVVNQNWVRAEVGSKVLNKPGYGRHNFSGITQIPTNSWCVKDWAAILRIEFCSSAPKRHPYYILCAFRILSLIKNEAKVCFDMLPRVRQQAAAFLLFCAHGQVGWMGQSKELLGYFCICPGQAFVCWGSIPVSSLVWDSRWWTGIKQGLFLFCAVSSNIDVVKIWKR